MVVISVEEGKIQGKIDTDIRGDKFYSFHNIPYAAPPIGKLRFKAPRPPLPWLGIRDATQEGSECISRHMITRDIVGSEDCLTLNVFTPDICPNDEAKPLRPVMFWIHGGVFVTGSSKVEIFGPDFLIAEDVVLVTINYRLGLLGFLSLDDPTLGVPGNAAFKDMVMALKWVQRNILRFCGDPNNVTVFGESAGAAAAHLLMLSPMTAGLLHRVIAQGACAFSPWVFGRRAAGEIARAMDFHSSDDGKLLEFLQNIPAEHLLKTQIKLEAEDFVEDRLRLFGAIVERQSNEESFLNESPLDIILSGNYNKVPLIIGYNSCDGAVIDTVVSPKTKHNYLFNLETSVPICMNILRGSPLSKLLAQKIKDFYFAGAKDENMGNYLKEFYTMTTDTSFLRGIYSSVKNHSATSASPVYLYRMSIETELNVFKKISGSDLPGAYHADDLAYLFSSILTPEIEPGSIEDISRRRFTKLWANFARFGNPTPDENDKLLNANWKPVKEGAVYFLDIGTELKLEINPEPERMAFWDAFYKYNPAVSKL